jgi:hypothetical protein
LLGARRGGKLLGVLPAYLHPVDAEARPGDAGAARALCVRAQGTVRWAVDPSQWIEGCSRSATCAAGGGACYVTASRLDRSRHGAALERILAAGHDAGPHGWNHDARPAYREGADQQRRMERARARFAGPPVAYTRTPWYARTPQLLEILARDFRYDSSVPNASGFFSATTRSGCCSVFPFRHPCGLLELPMTLPPDTALPRGEECERLLPLCDRIVELGGAIVATLHPQPHQAGNERGVAAHADFLEALRARHGDSLWSATPGAIVGRCAAARTQRSGPASR